MKSSAIVTCSDSSTAKRVPRDLYASTATKCTEKCLYWYNYTAPSSCYITNEGSCLTIKYDGAGDVTYNSASFTPESLRIYSPSLHRYNGQQSAAEIIVQHRSKSTSLDGLLVCIPISSEGGRTRASDILEAIILNAPLSENESKAPSIADFALNNLVPKSPFFAYEGPLPYGKCIPTSRYQYVVFHPSHAGAIAVTKKTISLLMQQIHFSYILATTGKDVFFNEKGSNAFNGDGQIYIQCQPTGSSEEEIMYKDKTDDSGPSSDMSFLWTILKIIVGAIIMVILFYGMKFAATMLDGKPTKTKAQVVVVAEEIQVAAPSKQSKS